MVLQRKKASVCVGDDVDADDLKFDVSSCSLLNYGSLLLFKAPTPLFNPLL